MIAPADPHPAVPDLALKKLVAMLDLIVLVCDPTAPDFDADDAGRFCAALRPLLAEAREARES
jgi:hypothetical protein